MGDGGIVELLELCGHWRMFPTSYQLEGVVKEGKYAKHTSNTTEIWKGKYKGKEVALKILRVHRDDPQAQAVELSVSLSWNFQTRHFFRRRVNRQCRNSARKQL